MIDIASINKTLPAAFYSTMPSQTPVASICKSIQCRHDNRFLNAQCHGVIAGLPTFIDHAVAIIVVASVSADNQIAIAPRQR